jgi:peptidoglycan hydrolase CwlO-like protein
MNFTLVISSNTHVVASQLSSQTIVQTEVLVTISPPRPVVIGEIEKLLEENKTLRDEIADLKKQIADLQREKNSCCKRANECEQKANNADSGWGL